MSPPFVGGAILCLIQDIGSHPAWGAWIEMSAMSTRGQDEESHPAWGAWIEMVTGDTGATPDIVAPRMGCVD